MISMMVNVLGDGDTMTACTTIRVMTNEWSATSKKQLFPNGAEILRRYLALWSSGLLFETYITPSKIFCKSLRLSAGLLIVRPFALKDNYNIACFPQVSLNFAIERNSLQRCVFMFPSSSTKSTVKPRTNSSHPTLEQCRALIDPNFPRL